MNTHPETRPSLCRQGVYYRFQLLFVRFEHQRLHYKVGSLQPLGSRLQHHTSSDIDGGAEGPVQELLACIASGGAHPCKESSNSCPLFQYSCGIVSWGKHHFSPICPVLLRRRHLLVFCRRPEGRGFFCRFSQTSGNTSPAGSPTSMSIPQPRTFVSSNERKLNASAMNRERAFDDMHPIMQNN